MELIVPLAKEARKSANNHTIWENESIDSQQKAIIYKLN
jgi:hypothetical protein